MQINQYWNKFLKEKGLDSSLKYKEAFKFGSGGELSDELLKLVLIGQKKATTSAYFKEEDYVSVGNYSIILNSKDEPKCVIQTTKTTILKFKDATFDLIKLEGEDKCLDTWRNNHIPFLKDDCIEYGHEFKEDMLIFFEEFECVYK